MIIQLKFNNLDYSSIVEAFGPALAARFSTSENLVGKLMSMLNHLSFAQLGNMLELIPQEDKNSFLSSVVDEKQDPIITALNSQLRQNSIDLHVNRITFSPDMELYLYLDNLSCGQFCNELLPIAAEKIPAVKSLISRKSLASKFISQLPDSANAQLIKAITKLATAYFCKKNHIALKLEQVCIKP